MKTFLHPVSARSLAMLGAFIGSLITPWCYGQGSNLFEQQDRYESLRDGLSELESIRGYYDPALIEELVSLADSAAALNLSIESSVLLNRAIQIQRQASGLFNADQVPLYFSLMKYDLNTGDWDSVNQSLSHLAWLLLEKQVISEESLIDHLIRLSEYHLLGVAGDVAEQRPWHFRQAAELTSLALEFSEDFWGRLDTRRIDLYYSQIKQLYLHSAALELGGDTAYALRQVIPGVNIVRSRENVQSRHYRRGLRLFREMREIMTEGVERPAESLAMLDLYVADWQLLFNNDRAIAGYQGAYGDLLQAGIGEDELNRLFSRAQIVPIPVFFQSVNQAMAERAAISSTQETVGPAVVDAVVFKDWFNSMPFVPFPVTSPALEQSLTADYTDTLLNIRLNSLESVSRWVKGTYRTQFGVVEEFSIAGETGNSAVDAEYLHRQLHFLHFRPSLENGVVRPFEGTLLYSMAME